MKQGLNANTIKGAAIAAMTIDHIAWVAFPGYAKGWLPLAMHILGRVTCPVMCYFIAEGYHHTRDAGRYTRRLFLFALLSHFAYLFALGEPAGWQSFVPFYNGAFLNQTSVLWPLAWGLVMLRVENSPRIRRQSTKVLLILLICLVTFPADWSCVASLCILAFGANRGRPKAQFGWMAFYMALYAGVYFFALDKVYGLVQLASVLAIPLLLQYNGQRGRAGKSSPAAKWLFYLYYPLHLFLLGCLRYLW